MDIYTFSEKILPKTARVKSVFIQMPFEISIFELSFGDMPIFWKSEDFCMKLFGKILSEKILSHLL